MTRNVVVYHQPGCAPCHRAMEFLEQQKLPVVDGEMMVGFNPQRLLQIVKP